MPFDRCRSTRNGTEYVYSKREGRFNFFLNPLTHSAAPLGAPWSPGPGALWKDTAPRRVGAEFRAGATTPREARPARAARRKAASEWGELSL